MRIGTFLISIIIFSLLSNIAYALDDTEKVFFQTQQEKLIAQVNAKIDSQTNRIEQDMKASVETAKGDIINQMTTEIKGSLRAVAIGLAGLIIVTLAIFKVIDLKISSTRNIKKYENLLHQKTEELNGLITVSMIERNELNNTRHLLAEYQKRLLTWDNHLRAKEQQQQQSQFQIPQQFSTKEPPKFGSYQQYQPQFTTPPYPQLSPQPQKRPLWKLISMFFMIIIILVLIGLSILKFFIL